MSHSLRQMLNMDWSDKVSYTKPTTTGKAMAATQPQSGFQPPKQIMGNTPPPKVERDAIKTAELQTIIIIPDVHSYARDINAFELCMKSVNVLSNEFNVTKIVQLGDLLECGELSQHKHSSVYERIPSYHEEVEWAMESFWKRLRETSTDVELIHLLGNHEDRMNKYILNLFNKPSKMSQSIYESLMPNELYGDYGVSVIPYGNEKPTDSMYWITPDLCCVHGWSFAMNAAKAHLDKTMGAASIIFGHIHRIQSYVRNNPMTGAAVGAWSFGALAKNNMFYQKGQPNDHSRGFGIVQTDGKYFNTITIPVLKDGSDDMVVLPHGETLRIKNG